jgi:hypothetical protein
MDGISSGSDAEVEATGPTPAELQVLIDATQEKLDKQPTEVNDPDYDERKIAQLTTRVADLWEQLQGVQAAMSDQLSSAASTIQRLYRTYAARQTVRAMIECKFCIFALCFEASPSCMHCRSLHAPECPLAVPLRSYLQKGVRP